jgi:hypothetical protein
MNSLFWFWYKLGRKAGWVSPVICNTHEGTYDWEGEENRQEWEDDGDPCVHVMVVLE